MHESARGHIGKQYTNARAAGHRYLRGLDMRQANTVLQYGAATPQRRSPSQTANSRQLATTEPIGTDGTLETGLSRLTSAVVPAA